MTGYIYKITNKINNKCYIGQTVKPIETRWKRHLKDTKKNSTYPLHRAIRKYGKENFIIEEIEKCEAKLLDEREIYWINFYNSFKNGYNATLGGMGNKLLDLNEQEVITTYLKLKTIEATKAVFNCSSSVIRNILNKNNIEIISASTHAKEKGNIIQRFSLNGELLEEYQCLNDAGQWLLDNKLTKAKDNRNAGMLVKTHIISQIPLGNYLWKNELYEKIDKEEYKKHEKQIKKNNYKKYSLQSKRKQNSKTKLCPICNKNYISDNAQKCVECYKKEQAKNIPPALELIELISSCIPLTTIAKKYNVSDAAIRKWCKKYNIPYKYHDIRNMCAEEWENLKKLHAN